MSPRGRKPAAGPLPAAPVAPRRADLTLSWPYRAWKPTTPSLARKPDLVVTGSTSRRHAGRLARGGRPWSGRRCWRRACAEDGLGGLGDHGQRPCDVLQRLALGIDREEDGDHTTQDHGASAEQVTPVQAVRVVAGADQ